MNVVITNGWHDDNKGDCGIVLSMIESLRTRAKSFTIISEFSAKDYRYKNAYRHILAEYPDVKIIPGSWPIYPILKLNNNFLSYCKIDKILGKLFNKFRTQNQKRIITRCMKVMASISNDSNTKADLLPNEFGEFFTALKNADVVISKGGSFIFSDSSIQGAFRLARVLYPLYIAKILRKNVVFFPQSFGKINGELSVSIALPLLRASTVFVREKLSGYYLKEQFNINSEYLPDVACYLSNKTEIPNPFTIKLDKLLNAGKILIGLTVRDWVFVNGRGDYVKSIVNIIKGVAERYSNAFFVFVPQVTGPVCFEDDRVIMKRVVAMIDSSLKKKIVVSFGDYSPYTLKMIYKKLNILIGTRLHSLIFSFTVGVPGIAIAYSENKTHGFYKEINCEDLVFNIDKLPILEFVEKTCLLIKDRDEVMNKFNNMLSKCEIQFRNQIKNASEKECTDAQFLNTNDLAWIDKLLIETKNMQRQFH
jgi:colanic acid/amylovoran biosynthesis protein